VLYLGGRSPLRADHGLAEGAQSISRYERGREATDGGNAGSAIVADACPVPILEVQSGRAPFEARIAGAVFSLSGRIADDDARPVPI
jgi:hypothetical protein